MSSFVKLEPRRCCSLTLLPPPFLPLNKAPKGLLISLHTEAIMCIHIARPPSRFQPCTSINNVNGRGRKVDGVKTEKNRHSRFSTHAFILKLCYKKTCKAIHLALVLVWEKGGSSSSPEVKNHSPMHHLM